MTGTPPAGLGAIVRIAHAARPGHSLSLPTRIDLRLIASVVSEGGLAAPPAARTSVPSHFDEAVRVPWRRDYPENPSCHYRRSPPGSKSLRVEAYNPDTHPLGHSLTGSSTSPSSFSAGTEIKPAMLADSDTPCCCAALCRTQIVPPP